MFAATTVAHCKKCCTNKHQTETTTNKYGYGILINIIATRFSPPPQLQSHFLAKKNQLFGKKFQNNVKNLKRKIIIIQTSDIFEKKFKQSTLLNERHYLSLLHFHCTHHLCHEGDVEAEAEVFLYSCLAPAAAVVLMERRKEVMEECLVKSESKYLKLLRNPWKIFKVRI